MSAGTNCNRASWDICGRRRWERKKNDNNEGEESDEDVKREGNLSRPNCLMKALTYNLLTK